MNNANELIKQFWNNQKTKTAQPPKENPGPNLKIEMKFREIQQNLRSGRD
jgi:hypothetical protein